MEAMRWLASVAPVFLLYACDGSLVRGPDLNAIPCPLASGDCPDEAPDDDQPDGLSCRLFGELSERLVLFSDNEHRFALDSSSSLAMRVVFQAAGPPLIRTTTEHLEIAGPASLPLHPAGPLRTAKGSLVLDDTLDLEDVRIQGDHLVANVELETDVRAVDVRIPCSHLALGTAKPSWLRSDGVDGSHTLLSDEAFLGENDSQSPKGRWTRALNLHETVDILDHPDGERVLTLQMMAKTVEFDVIAQQPQWLEVRWTSRDRRIALRGWVEAQAFELTYPDAGGAISGGAGSVISCLGSRAAKPKSLQERVLVPVGTFIHSSPGGPSWARVIKPFEVVMDEAKRSGAWMSLDGVPGIYAAPMWVRATPVK